MDLYSLNYKNPAKKCKKKVQLAFKLLCKQWVVLSTFYVYDVCDLEWDVEEKKMKKQIG